MGSLRHPFALWLAHLPGAEPSKAKVPVLSVQRGGIVVDTDWLTPWIIEFGDKITQFLMNFSRRLASTMPRRGFLDLFPEFPGSLTAAREAVGLPCLVRSPQA